MIIGIDIDDTLTDIRDELKKVEPAVSSKADTQKDPETLKKQEEVFKL